MEGSITYSFFTLSAILIISSLFFGLAFELLLRYLRGGKTNWYLVVIRWFVGLGVFFAVCGMFSMRSLPLEIYDVEIRIRYVDGYSMTIRKDSITYEELPKISAEYRYTGIPWAGGKREYLDTYSIYFGGERYRGVVRYECLKKRPYSVNYIGYYKNRLYNKIFM